MLKIANVELKNIRNVKKGNISFIKEFEDKIEDYENVMAIYGPNASGKTAAIYAIDTVSCLLNSDKAFDISEMNILHIDSIIGHIALDILSDDNFYRYYVEFCKNSLNKTIVKSEKLVIGINKQALIKDSFIDGKVVFDIDYEEIDNSNYSEDLNNEKVKIFTQIAQENVKLLLTSNVFLKNNTSFEDEDIYNCLSCIGNLPYKINVIMDHDSKQNDQYTKLLLFDVDSKNNKNILVDIRPNNIVSIKERNQIVSAFEKINRILNVLVTDLEIVLEENKHGENYNITYLTKRNGVSKYVPLHEESYGVIKFISMAISFSNVINNNEFILLIDELDAGIFEYLLGQIIDTIDTYAKGQLIFTSHNLHIIEHLKDVQVTFSTVDPEHGYINVVTEENLRTHYARLIKLGGAGVKLYNRTKLNDIILELYDL